MDQKTLGEVYTEGFVWAAAEITRLRAALDAMTAERDAALSVIRALLDADEHGQGVAWQDAMERAHAMSKTPS